jgi:GT2 family glycosyltransferase
MFRLGIFDEKLLSGGDIELGVRMKHAGIKLGYAENSIVYHYHRTSVRGLIEQYTRYGFNEGMVIAGHSQQLKRRIWVRFDVPRQILSYTKRLLVNLLTCDKQGVIEAAIAEIMTFCLIWGRFSAGVKCGVLIL